jgi:hypothetical protein
VLVRVVQRIHLQAAAEAVVNSNSKTTLEILVLVLHALQINIRARELSPKEDSGIA